jgi:LysR family carnitine catabolism transcriptional activator
MNLTIRQLEIVVALGETLSFTAAATKLKVSQPSVSEALKRVEAQLGFRLIDRSTRNLSLTPEGRHVVASAREAVRSLKFTFEVIANRRDGQRGRVVVAALPSIVCTLLPPAIREFRDLFPGVEIDIRDALQDRALSLLDDGLVDMALVARPKDTEQYTFSETTSDTMHLICHHTHPLAERREISWSELAGEVFIAMSANSSVRHLTDAGFLQAKQAINPKYEVDQITSAAALASARLGVTALPSLTFDLFQALGLRQIPLINPSIRRHLGFVYARNRWRSPASEDFANFVLSRGGHDQHHDRPTPFA